MPTFRPGGPGHPSQQYRFDVTRGVQGTAIFGAGSGVENDDTITATGTETFTGTVAVTQAAQTSTATGTETITGTVAVTQAANTSTATGTETFTGTVAVTQAAQTSSATTTETFAGTLAITQAANTSAGTGTETITGTVGVTQQGDTSTATGTGGLEEVIEWGGARGAARHKQRLALQTAALKPKPQPVTVVTPPPFFTATAAATQASDVCTAIGFVDLDAEFEELILVGIL